MLAIQLGEFLNFRNVKMPKTINTLMGNIRNSIYIERNKKYWK